MDPSSPTTLDRQPPAEPGADTPCREERGWLACGYRNASDRMVIVRCCGPGAFYLERVVFPFELLSFQGPPGSEVEIWTHGLGGPELLEATGVEDLALPEGIEQLPTLSLEGGETTPWWAGSGQPAAADP